MSFEKWLDTFIKEKGIDLDITIDVQGPSGWNVMSYRTVYEHMKIANATEQAKIKNVIVRIDFNNGDVLDFFRHLANAIAI